MNRSSDAKASMIFFVPFAITFLDSAFAYFANPLGITVTANAVVPLLLLCFLGSERIYISVPRATLIWLCILSFSLMLAILTARGIGLHRLFETASCVASFLAGYVLWRRVADENRLARWLIALSAAYVVICLIALFGVDPAHFPITYHFWSQNGLAQARPQITADSNMQVYYLFPAALALALPFRLMRMSLLVPTMLGGLYVLAQLQTRSGTLAYCGIILLTMLAPLWNPSLGRWKMLIYPAAVAVALIAFLPIVYHVAELLLYRFTQADIASGNGRVGSTLYAFQHALDPYWWIPRGSDEFLLRHGGLPHSNLTAVFLDGGLLGLVAWIALVIGPIVQTGARLMRRELDAAATMALIAAIGVLIVQLSLHNPMRDQIWLWAGALIGALVRTRSAHEATAPSVAVPTRQALRIDSAGIINSARP